ncbi:BlaR1 family beta-lactam sensor/signal transducer [Bacillus solitudinis]|uniref:BlaR1 family beta-lactam sensor/signal transducer n=1 Tax=Bacillus solitudinis TaxID=2014074 RepID=UPI000C23A4ED|nr:BlaR1 family beta-lactam sensor/signal transducer [Bacillus solitudinis]
MGDSFFTLFLISNILVSVILGMILLLKKAANKQITVSAHYHISLITLFILVAPFIPFRYFNINLVENWLINFRANHSIKADNHADDGTTDTMNHGANWLQDFSMSIEQSSMGILDAGFFLVWVVGIISMLTVILHSNVRIGKMKKSLQVVKDKELIMLFNRCKEELAIHKTVVLGYCSWIKSPLTFGVFQPYIVLPKEMSMLSVDEVKCVLLHELYHCKRKDMLVNYFMFLVKTVYWFNPIVWYFLRELKTEMEISCDYAVLKTLNQDLHLQYGKVILKFASFSQGRPSFLAASEISSPFKQVKRRIVGITNFEVESQRIKMKSIFVLIAVFCFLLVSAPTLSALALPKENHSFGSATMKNKDYINLFDEFSGSAVLYDSSKKQYSIYNQEESTTRYAPASTYKIFNSLFALETGIITRDDSQLIWDGTPQPYEEWNQDHDLFSAMKSSASWYFQALDQQIGIEKLQSYFNEIEYGNRHVAGNLSDYWLDGTLTISPVEQVDLLRKFYDNEFMFEPDNIQIVKDSLLLEEKKGKRLFGKTGTAVLNGEQIDGWFVGYVETVDNTIFFAVHIQGEKQAGGSSAAKIALSILEKEELY